MWGGVTDRGFAASTAVLPRISLGIPDSVSHFRPNTPLVVALTWLGGTYIAFLLLGQVGQVPDLLQLSVFIGATLLALTVGYQLESNRHHDVEPRAVDTSQVRIVVVLSGIYLAAYGVALLASFGAASPLALLNALTSPGEAYASKFDVYAGQAEEAANPAIQVLTLLAVLYLPLVPFTVLFWERLTAALRVFSLTAVSIYASFYLYIGTLKGLADLLIFGLVGAVVRQAQRSGTRDRKRTRRRMVALGAIAVTVFAGYMTLNLAQRLVVFENEASFAPNALIKAVAGDEIARGVSVVLFYPTHGYLGLAHNLDMPFVWTRGQGSSRAIDSYLAQYGVAPSVAGSTYPARTEALTGWSQDVYWATAYPWFASDLTFPGVVLMMGVLGWWLSRLWREAVRQRSQLALLLLADLMLFVMFIPANNQIGLSRPATIGFVSLCLLYILNRSAKRSSALVPVGEEKYR